MALMGFLLANSSFFCRFFTDRFVSGVGRRLCDMEVPSRLGQRGMLSSERTGYAVKSVVFLHESK